MSNKKDKDIEEMDATEYLLSSEANKKNLLESMKQAEEGKLVKVDLDDF